MQDYYSLMVMRGHSSAEVIHSLRRRPGPQEPFAAQEILTATTLSPEDHTALLALMNQRRQEAVTRRLAEELAAQIALQTQSPPPQVPADEQAYAQPQSPPGLYVEGIAA